ncbi:MAG: Stk1 family PASTA domain-containing Ser/Thr kinase [Frankiales bacterium]|nr:MAG: Stk1 family PASTA domain-containing Ser/Thr kinase [Frankiales bacterium]
MATVYEATDLRLDRTVAVKVMRPALAEDGDFVERFAREARAAARLSSPEVVAVHDQGTDSATGTAYLVMEHVAGRTLRDVIRDQGPLAPARALELLEPVLKALAAAHGAGLVHRDVKPENVLLGDDGRVKVADFGLARAIESSNLTATTGLLIGTVAYLAPEQVEHGRADTRTDVYAAGILLFELLTGVPPYSSDSPMSVAYRHVHEDVPPPSELVTGIPTELDDLVVSATRRDPAARPVDAGAFLAELRAVRADLGAAAREPGVRLGSHPTLVVPRDAIVPPPPATPANPANRAEPAPPATPRARRRPPRKVLLPLLLALLLLAGTGTWWLAAGRYGEAPSAFRLDRAAATAALEAAGFEVDVNENPRYSETVAPGLVMGQDPEAGDRVRKGSTIELFISRGPDRRAVPSLIGTPQADAVAALEKAGLGVGAVTEQFSSKAASGTVLSSSPASGEKLKPGTRVALVVSKGPELLAVPDVVGKDRAAAEKALADAGFGAAVTEVFSDTVKRGVVVAQDPATGRAPRDSAVALQVSKGPQLITVPDVVGDRVRDAEARLEALGLRVRVNRIPGPGIVRSTDPRAGEQVRKGSTVTLNVF